LLDLQINGTSEWNFSGTVFGIGEANDIAVGTTTGTKIGTAAAQKLGFFGVTPVVQQTELTDELTTITHTAPGTADFAIQNLVAATGYGFVTEDEGNTVLSVIANLQARVNELETKLVALGFLADAD
jgi:bifunctional N-acetylglucosamine-1-phosphate-uridyltransferase/glucosamine-1-phosphate-acetyltransferase GlmU-like protein